MLLDKVLQHCPSYWSFMDANSGEYELICVPKYSPVYCQLAVEVIGPFNLGIKKIVRVQNPLLYGQFLLKKEEYATRGPVEVLRLFHDTAEENIPSIVSSNLDWRLVSRVKFGQGVSFSPCPAYANRQSSHYNGSYRAMIVADVLVGNTENGRYSTRLPSSGYDTTVGNNFKVYVKYYDNEFYPKYVVYYKSI